MFGDFAMIVVSHSVSLQRLLVSGHTEQAFCLRHM